MTKSQHENAPNGCRHQSSRSYHVLWPLSRRELDALSDLGMSAQQIATYLGVTVGAVLTHMMPKLELTLARPLAGEGVRGRLGSEDGVGRQICAR